MVRTEHTTTKSELRAMGLYNVEVKDATPHGRHIVLLDSVEVGDKVLLNNYFHKVVA